jgi:hypothetical protein
MSNSLNIKCTEWREVAEIFPTEMEVIMEMMIEAEIEICD